MTVTRGSPNKSRRSDPDEFHYPDSAVLACPFPFYQSLQELAPVYKVPGRNDYLISRYEDVTWCFKETGLLSSRREFTPAADAEMAAIAATQRYPVVPAVTDVDPPLHKTRRALMFKVFTPAKLRRYETQIRAQIDELIDGFADRGQADFVSEFAVQLPVRVICDLLAIDSRFRPQIKQWTESFTEMLAQFQSGSRRLEMQQGFTDFYNFLGEQVEERYKNPGEDVLSELIEARYEDGGRPDTNVLVNMLRNLVVAGHETTTSMLASTLHLLISNPEHYRAVASDFKLVPRLLEESLRLESPTQWVPRISNRDFTLRGVDVPQGARVLLLCGAANRDADYFEAPEQIKLERRNLKDHTAFGYGIHFCLGAPLARMEGRITFERLLTRLKNIALAPGADVAPVGTAMLYHLRSLPIVFERA
jgi:cytochrome P450